MRVLIVEDEQELAALIRSALEKQHFVTDLVDSIATATEALRGGGYGCVILDRTLTDGDGLALLPVFRSALPGIPILVISALRAAHDKIEGLNQGADDYLQKPFSLDELIARIRAIIRRAPHLTAPAVSVGRLTLDAGQGATMIGGEPFTVGRREYLILEALMRRPGLVVRRSALMDRVYGLDDEVQENSLDVHVSRLRKKLADREAHAEIHTIRALGYLIRAGDS